MPLSPEILAQISSAMIEGCPQARALGFESVSIKEAHAAIRLPYHQDLIGDPATGVLAGGAVTTLLDHTCGQAVWSAMDAITSIATLDLRIDYMRAARPGRGVVAHAHCYKLTRSIAFVRAQAYDEEGAYDEDTVAGDATPEPIATAQATFMLNSNGNRRAGANLAPAGMTATDGGEAE